jgi:hypothetical protein
MSGSRYNYKNLLKPRFIIIYIVIAIFIVSVIVTTLSLINLSNRIDSYSKNISKISDNIIGFNKDFSERTLKLSAAELLLNNTNLILSTVYFGTADTDEQERAKDFTAFSLMYKDKFYVITAGHCVDMDGEKYKNFKFKANNKDYYDIFELIDYKSDYKNNKDYAIFYDPRRIRTGLYPADAEEDQTPRYVLGNIERGINLVKRYSSAVEGESGSPILNSNCHVVGIMIKKGGAYTPIGVVLDALDSIKLDD